MRYGLHEKDIVISALASEVQECPFDSQRVALRIES